MLEVRTIGSDAAPATLKRFIYSNHLQSASLELDESGNIISYEEYHPYGTTAYQAMNSDIGAVAKRYRFTGKERDEESGMSYHGARYYIPWLCRWAAVDPKQGERSTLSPYNYCQNDPVNRTDPSGMLDGDGDKDKAKATPPNYGSAAIPASIPYDYAPNKPYYVKPEFAPAPAPLDLTPSIPDVSPRRDIVVHHQVRAEHLAPGRPAVAALPFPDLKMSATPFRTPNQQAEHEEQRVNFMHDNGRNADGSPRLLLRLQNDKGFQNFSDRMVGAAKVYFAAESVIGLGRVVAAGSTASSIGLSSGGTSVNMNATGWGTSPMKIERLLPQGTKIADVIDEGKTITWQTGNESAVVRLANGDKALVSGGPGGIYFEEGQIKTIFGHIHPIATGPSAGDYEALEYFNQSKQYIFESGQQYPIYNQTMFQK